MNTKTENNWVSKDEIETLWNKLKKEADLLYKKETLTKSDLQSIQQFIILTLYSGLFIPPRRALDYCNMKLTDVNKKRIIT